MMLIDMCLSQGDGTGVSSIYSEQPFADESFKMKHDQAGLLSMVRWYWLKINKLMLS